ncbi:Oligopeptide transport ATP-binding protein OppD [archaeon HR06]|nr:Oligopeptide transport ATP-binding protein OppD [archaeon HR06]
MKYIKKLLEVKDLRINFETLYGTLKVINGVNLVINEGEIVGLVGESGCGKSTLALSIIGLLPPNAKLVGGKIYFQNNEINILDEKSMEKIRGRKISMVFQEPLTSLNPVLTIGEQLMEVIKIGSKDKNVKKEEAIEWLRKVGIPDPERTLKRYPHELSGGMRQRIMILMALVTKPLLMIADEPTTALDVTTEAQILRLVKRLVEENKVSVLFISHDLGVVAQIADRVAVMYAGKIVEESNIFEIFENPLHPYTKDLLSSLPKLGGKSDRLLTIKGSVPNLFKLPKGCIYHPRCKYVMSKCMVDEPELKEYISKRKVSCFLY